MHEAKKEYHFPRRHRQQQNTTYPFTRSHYIFQRGNDDDDDGNDDRCIGVLVIFPWKLPWKRRTTDRIWRCHCCATFTQVVLLSSANKIIFSSTRVGWFSSFVPRVLVASVHVVIGFLQGIRNWRKGLFLRWILACLAVFLLREVFGSLWIVVDLCGTPWFRFFWSFHFIRWISLWFFAGAEKKNSRRLLNFLVDLKALSQEVLEYPELKSYFDFLSQSQGIIAYVFYGCIEQAIRMESIFPGGWYKRRLGFMDSLLTVVHLVAEVVGGWLQEWWKVAQSDRILMWMMVPCQFGHVSLVCWFIYGHVGSWQ